MAKPYPEEFRRDVIAVARRGEIPLTQVAKDLARVRVGADDDCRGDGADAKGVLQPRRELVCNFEERCPVLGELMVAKP